MVREVVVPKSDRFTINIPKEYIDKRVEILITPIRDKKDTKSSIIEKTSGILKKRCIDPVKWQKEIRSDRKI